MTDVQTETPLFRSDLASDRRLRASFDRLARPDYAVEAVLAESSASDWPGDVAGRLLLALARSVRAGSGADEHARELADGILGVLAPQGYFGAPLGDVVDEQQVACHGWVVSGLLQWAAVSGDERARDAALRITDVLTLPALARLDGYPRTRRVEPHVGEASGTSVVEVGGWLLSSDTWCVFLALNGLVPAYRETGREDVRSVIEVLADELDALDLIGQEAQLHAVLAAARCLADLGAATEDARLLGIAQRTYDSYVQHARTLNFATYNWFGRPGSWTEPCAIVDSLAVAHTLWDTTGERRYLRDAERIEYNGLGYAERQDGSFGLDSVATAEYPELGPTAWDARWCCTMRGAVGLVEARERTVHHDASAQVLRIDGPHTGTARVGTDGHGWTVGITTSWPEAGDVRLEVLDAPAGAPSLRVEVRTGDDDAAVELRPERGHAEHLLLPLRDTEVRSGGHLMDLVGPVVMVEAQGGSGEQVPLTRVGGTFPEDAPVRVTVGSRVTDHESA